eukprot:GHVN01013167.1.p1 GENE.GHVN01013167.1~~GHVN01013167.1.p1  ORF type:complete len:391 (-),score=70.62 GHVN01013167.1:55-1227(-)
MDITSKNLKVSIIGSGNWGSSISKVIAENTKTLDLFDDEVRQWVFEEEWKGKKLSEVINETHENEKYLPGVRLPSNVKAVPDVVEAARGADLLVFVLPHQFIEAVCAKLIAANVLKPTSEAISLIKGLIVQDGSPQLISDYIQTHLKIRCSVLSGANVAPDIANEQFSETTIGYLTVESGQVWQLLFDRPYFRVNCLPDVSGVETCGAVKNVIALAAGFCDGLGLGTNTKAAIIRLGVHEMKLFCLCFWNAEIVEETFFDSAGWADVITTCFGGRHVRVASAFAKAKVDGKPKTWQELETDMLKGMKLQGQITCREVFSCLSKANLLDRFPLFRTTHAISFGDAHPSDLIKVFENEPLRPIHRRSDITLCKRPTGTVGLITTNSGHLGGA